jgi:excisionase family DNA binding protein
MSSELLTLEEVARYLKVSPRTVRNYVRDGRLPAPLRLGPRCVRWRRGEVEALGQPAEQEDQRR